MYGDQCETFQRIVQDDPCRVGLDEAMLENVFHGDTGQKPQDPEPPERGVPPLFHYGPGHEENTGGYGDLGVSGAAHDREEP